MKKFQIVVFCICTISFFGCSSQLPQQRKPPVTWTKKNASVDEIQNAKVKIISQLKDPESAIFGEVWAMNGTNGQRTICGYINARNSYGGYTGQKMFTLFNDSSIIEGDGALGNLLPSICMPRTVN